MILDKIYLQMATEGEWVGTITWSEDRINDDDIPYISVECHQSLIEALYERNIALLNALKEIAEGKGAFSRDHLTHASNVIDNMKGIAEKAIAIEEELGE